jgi:hypothetical protein
MRRASGPRCRSSLAWGAALFLAGQVGFGVGLDLFAPLARFPSARAVLREAEPPPRVVFFGSSRFGASIADVEVNTLLRASLPSANARVLNAAVPGGDGISTEFLLGRLLAKGCKPDWVFVEVSPENFKYPGPWFGVQVVRQLGWREVPTHFPEAVRSNDGMRYVGSLLLPGHVHREVLLEAVAEWLRPPAPREQDAAAVGPIDWQSVLPPPDVTASADHRARLHPGALTARQWLRNYRVGGQTPLALERVLRRCRDESIGAVLLIPPLATGHREEYLPPIEAAFRARLGRLQREYGCQVIDARDWLPDALFRDASHPSLPEGQVRFSRLLTRRVLLDLLDPRGVGHGEPGEE